MTLRRIFATGLACAGLYAGALGPAGAVAQDPTPEATSTSTPAATVTPASTPVQTATPGSTATPAWTVTATPGSTQTATPTPSTTPDATPTVLPTPTSTPGGKRQDGHGGRGDADGGSITVDIGGGGKDDKAAKDRGKGKGTGKGTGKATGKAGDAHEGDATTDVTGVTCAVDAPAEETDEARKDEHRRKHSTSSEGRDCAKELPEVHTEDKPAPAFRPDGVPTTANPTVSISSPGPAPVGVPNFFIEKFRIPPFLLPIYQAAGTEYGIRWEILAAINEIETDYGRNLNVSSAGALGWMQFMPATWRAYGVDANQDGVKDPYNPVDAIFAAARYLKAAGAQDDLRRGIFAYNHADWYVDSVLLRARMIGGLPADFVGSLTGLTQARFPVQAEARYADAIDTDQPGERVRAGQNAAVPIEGSEDRTGIDIFSKDGAPVVAVNDATVVGLGQSDRLGRYIRVRDAYGNVFTYSQLDSVATTYPAPRPKAVTKRDMAVEKEPKADPAPTRAASSTSQADAARVKADARDRKAGAGKASRKAKRQERRAAERAAAAAADLAGAPVFEGLGKDRLFANPKRPNARAAGGELQLAEAGYRPLPGAVLKLNRRDYVAKPMRVGARVISGSILGRIGRTTPDVAPHVHFEIKPSGRGAPRIDPKPILDGWKLLESTEMYRAEGRNPFVGPDARQPSIGQILLMSKDELQRHVLSNPRIDVYECGRRDIRLGVIDRRVLATLEFLASSGLRPTVTSLQCGHGYYTASGNVSHHSSGNAVDIAAVNGIVITPSTQGPGSITEMTIERLLTLQSTMKPAQIISLMTFPGHDNTVAMADHGDHIHVGFQPLYASDGRAARQVDTVLKPDQWIKLIDRLGEIDNPVVPSSPSKYALKAKAAD